MVAQKISRVDKLKTLFSLMFIVLIRKFFFASSSKKVNAPCVVQDEKFVAHFATLLLLSERFQSGNPRVPQFSADIFLQFLL